LKGPRYQVLTELQTLERAQTDSLARFGDGEWRCAIGGGCTSQKPDPKLAAELRQVLSVPVKNLTVCLPHRRGPRAESWAKYEDRKFTDLATLPEYGSAFITRPDNAPWIDTPDFWSRVRDLWRGKHVVLVVGDKKSVTSEMIGDSAASIREVWGPRQHAYADIDRLMGEAHLASGESTDVRFLLCLGTTATVMAWRLAREGYHAIDLGHIGMFMRHAGAYRYALDDVVSPAYRMQLVALHNQQRWGADGGKHTAAVRALWQKFQPKTVLDYGCGENRLAESLKEEFRISGYDPGIPTRASMPKPCDMLICTDVLEHVEPAKLDAVLDHIWRVTGQVGYLVISTKLANAVLPDGRNAHLSVHAPEWWMEKLRTIGWSILEHSMSGKDLTVTVLK
jgi:hypothetical protein